MNSNNNEKVILTLFGSFNPPTNGHLSAASLARDEMQDLGFNVLKVLMVPVHSGYGKKGLLSGDVRAKMCQAIAEKTDFLEVERFEVDRDKYSCTVETLRYLKKKYNARPVIICGYDLVESFDVKGSWDDSDIIEILSEYGLCILPRCGERKEASELCSRIKGRDKFIYQISENPLEMISSTLARNRISAGHNVYGILDPSVIDIIKKNQYYK